ncbi:hypothetical protein KSP39_PZI017208 [Platanthera zijinensis]|uniref:DUF1421 domain-containing protein n=1 Tax=Platanthera zijinensis TaxID=2320716 RepID=A0AAP0B4Y7_9ASPA
MDKQIMGLSGSPAGARGISAGGGGELFNPVNSQEDRRENSGVLKREEILPNYDFQPIRPAPSPPTGSVDDAGGLTRFSSGPLYGLESTLGPDIKLAHHYGASVDDVENTVKKYTDILLHALEGMSSRLSQLESRTCILENSVDDLKVSNGNNYGSTDGKLRQLENILREVQTGVQVLRDRQEIAEAHLELTKLQLSSKKDHNLSETLQAPTDPQQTQQYHQPIQQTPQLPPIFSSMPPPPPNAPPPPPPPPPLSQHNQSPPYIPQLPAQPQMPSIPSPPVDHSYSKPPHQVIPQYALGQSHEPTHQPPQYQMPQPQYQSPSQVIPHYSQPIQSEDPNSYIMPPSQSYPPNMRQPSPPSQPPAGPPLHQYYGANNSNLPVPSSYGGPAAGFSEPYAYGGSPSHYNTKPSPFSSALPTSGGSGNYQRLPTAKILPQAAPAGTSSSGGGSTGNRVPVDDVVDKVSTMGFSREQVRATVRKLTENGQSVDLNVVLDKLMNGGEAGNQPAKGWFGR